MQNIANMSPQSKIWIYGLPRELSQSETDFCSQKLHIFIDQWQNHGTALAASFEILENRFIILAADASIASVGGCSIDKSVHLMQEIGQALQINFLERVVFYVFENTIKTAKLTEIKNLVATQIIKANTLIYNTNCVDMADFNANFKIEAQKTWLNKYFVPILQDL